LARYLAELRSGLACSLGVARRRDMAVTTKMKMEVLGGLGGLELRFGGNLGAIVMNTEVFFFFFLDLEEEEEDSTLTVLWGLQDCECMMYV